MRSPHDQPWIRVKIRGKRCRVQVLDPDTAFDLEPRLVEALGDQLALTLAAPRHVGQKLVDAAAAADPIGGRALVEMMGVARLLEACLRSLNITPDLALHVAETVLLDRLEHGGRVVEVWDDFVDMFGRSPRTRWSAVAIAMSVTYGPLWTRQPYHLRTTTAAGPKVPEPPGVSRTRMWCEQLAAQGHAPSSVHILREWTPVDVLEAVESLAFVAERERRAQSSARSG